MYNQQYRWSSVYVHVPFCASRCVYCGFYSTVGSGLETDYVSAMEQELSLRTDYLPKEYPIRTIYFGGGTPSQLSPTLLARMLRSINDQIVLPRNHGSAVEELTIECNPDDVDMSLAISLRAMGVNRVSLGIQTFDEARLHFLHRRHTAHEAVEAISHLRSAGIDNISIDLMFGFPDETIEDWEHDIECALSLRPSHLSAYGLTYEDGTPLERLLREGRVNAIDEEVSRDMYDVLCTRLNDAGYEQYEISNFALPNRRSIHNSGYWSGVPYLGIGAAAHSYDGVSRQWNVSDLRQYIEQVGHGVVPMEREVLDEPTLWDDMIVTALRTCEGISLDHVRKVFGDEYLQFLLQTSQSYLEHGLLKIDDNHLHLTHEGIHVSDMIMSELMKD